MFSKPLRRTLAAGALAGALALLAAAPASAGPRFDRDGRAPAFERHRGNVSWLWSVVVKKLISLWDAEGAVIIP